MADDDAASQIRQMQQERGDLVGLSDKGGHFDKDIYGGKDKYEGFMTELPTEDETYQEFERGSHPSTKSASVNAGSEILSQMAAQDGGDDPMEAYREQHGSGLVNTKIADRESEYQARRRNLVLSPDRGDMFGGTTPARTYAEIMKEKELERETFEMKNKIVKAQKEKEEAEKLTAQQAAANGKASKRKRWDDTGSKVDATPVASKWDATPGTNCVCSMHIYICSVLRVV
jgi:splicing factor 3B subunit 1